MLAALDPIVAELAPGWRVSAQVSLPEVLDADSVEAFNTINAKRVDYLLVDAEMRPRHAIEYQGRATTRAPLRRGMRSRRKRCGGRESAMPRCSPTTRRRNCG